MADKPPSYENPFPERSALPSFEIADLRAFFPERNALPSDLYVFLPGRGALLRILCSLRILPGAQCTALF